MINSISKLDIPDLKANSAVLNITTEFSKLPSTASHFTINSNIPPKCVGWFFFFFEFVF